MERRTGGRMEELLLDYLRLWGRQEEPQGSPWPEGPEIRTCRSCGRRAPVRLDPEGGWAWCSALRPSGVTAGHPAGGRSHPKETRSDGDGTPGSNGVREPWRRSPSLLPRSKAYPPPAILVAKLWLTQVI